MTKIIHRKLDLLERFQILLIIFVDISHQSIGDEIKPLELCNPVNFGTVSGRAHVYSCSHPEWFDIYDFGTAIWIHFDETCRPPLIHQIPGNLFTARRYNILRLILTIYGHSINGLTKMPSTVLDGVRSTLVELQLIGFLGLQYIEPGSFRDLKNINCIHIRGAERLYPQQLRYVFDDLKYSPLNNFHLVKNQQTAQFANSNWDLNEIFSSPNRNITRFSINDAFISSFTGRLSKHLPSLELLELSLSVAAEDGSITLIDALACMPNLRYLYIYAYPIYGPNPVYQAISFNFQKLVEAFDGSATLLNFLKFEPGKKDNCFRNASIHLSPSLTSVSVNGVYLYLPNALMPTSTTYNYDSNVKLPSVIQYCMDGGNNLEHLNLVNSPFPSGQQEWRMTGATRLRKLSWRHCNISVLFPEQFYEMPRLEELWMAENNLRDFVASDIKAKTFRGCPNLRVLDLSTCNLEYIPDEFFTNLPSLEFLYLANNTIKNADFMLRTSAALKWLGLNGNCIEALSSYAMKELEALATNDSIGVNGSLANLVVDLSMNPLSCLCANLEFVRWIQASTKIITFPNLENYTCLYPDGTKQTLIAVNTWLVSHKCKIIDNLQNGSDCPCDYQELDSLYKIRFSLDQYYCKYPDGKLVQMKSLDPNATVRICEKAASKIPLHTILPPTVILPVAFCIGFIVLFLAVYKRQRPAQFEQMLQCLALHQLTGALMTIVFHRIPTSDPDPEYTAFVAYPPEDRERILDEFIPALRNGEITVMTEDDIPFGSPRIESLMESFARCRSIVLVLTPAFLADDWCKETTRMAVASLKPLVPLVYRSLQPDVTENVLLGSILLTSRPLYWSETDSFVQCNVFNELRVRLTRGLRAQIALECGREVSYS